MFYVIEVVTYNDDTPKSKGMYEYETKTEALSMYHKKLGGAMGNVKYETTLVKVITHEGIEIATTYWKREQPEPNPESEN